MQCVMNSPRIETPPSLPRGRWRRVAAASKTLCEAVHIIERGMAGPLLACRRRRARTFKEGGLRQNKNPDRAGIFCPTLQAHEASHATVIATLPNPPAEIIDAYSWKLSSESMKTAQAPVSPVVFVCVPTARRRTCKTLKGLLSFGAMRNVRAVNCSAVGWSAL